MFGILNKIISISIYVDEGFFFAFSNIEIPLLITDKLYSYRLSSSYSMI